jgi:hypothetical protein
MKIQRTFIVLILTIGLLLIAVSPGLAELPTPSNDYGMVELTGDKAALDTTVWANDNKYSNTMEFLDKSGAVNNLDAPGEYPDTLVTIQGMTVALQQGDIPTNTPVPQSEVTPTNGVLQDEVPTDTPVPQLEYTLTVVSANGTVTKNPNQATYHSGDVVQLTANPNAGWTFAYWSGGLSGNSNPASLTIQGSTVVAANYIQNDYTLTVTYAGGTVIKSPNLATYHYGDVVQLTAVPAAGWAFAYWSDGLSGSANPVSLTIQGDVSVTAKFRRISTPEPAFTTIPTYIIQIRPSPTPSGTVQPSPTATIPAIPPTPTLAPFVWPSSTPVVPKFLPDVPSNNFNLQLAVVVFLSAIAIIIVIWAVRNRTWRSR